MATAAAIYVGEQNAEFYQFKTVLADFGREVEPVRSLEAAKKLLETQAINLIILNLGLDQKQTREIVEEIRRERPRIQFMAVGRSFHDVIEDNYFYIARGMDGTITIEQFRKAVADYESQRYAGISHMGLGTLCIAGIVFLAVISTSAVGKFLGAFWSTLLIIEFTYYLVSSRKRQATYRSQLP